MGRDHWEILVLRNCYQSQLFAVNISYLNGSVVNVDDCIQQIVSLTHQHHLDKRVVEKV